MTDRLQQLLRDADVEAPRASDDTARLVRHRHAIQRRNHRIAAAACLFAMASIAIALSLRRERPHVIATAPPPQVASLDDRIHEMTVAKLELSRRRAKQPAKPPADLQLQRDTAALILVYDAEQ